jgi:hypothetical protein
MCRMHILGDTSRTSAPVIIGRFQLHCVDAPDELASEVCVFPLHLRLNVVTIRAFAPSR